MFDKALENYLNKKLSAHFSKKQEILSIIPVHGGSINSCFHLKTGKGSYFIKINDAKKYPDMFETEVKGLSLLKPASTFHIPEIYFIDEHNGRSFLLMEFIQSDTETAGFWGNFAKSLAELHRNTADNFGLDHDNYIGSLKQYNKPKSSWTNFYIENRLAVQEKMARDSGKINFVMSKKFDRLYSKLENLFPEEKPALIHGDLWSGNFMTDPEGKPVIIDPAVYYGHREMDIAMSQLFGGFSAKLYNFYQEYFPMEKAWQERMDLYQLYPLMVHVNLFGGTYAMQVKGIMEKYT